MVNINENSLDKSEDQRQTDNIFPLDINAITIEIGTLREQISNQKNDSNKKDNLINNLLIKVSRLEKDKGRCKELTDNQIVFWGNLNLII